MIILKWKREVRQHIIKNINKKNPILVSIIPPYNYPWTELILITSPQSSNKMKIYCMPSMSCHRKHEIKVTFQQRTSTPTVEINSNSDCNILFLINILNK